jgi:hypothetical protein
MGGVSARSRGAVTFTVMELSDIIERLRAFRREIANDELKQLASQKNVDLPQDLSAKDKATKATLEKLSGEQFDQASMKDMVKDHKKDVSDFRRESRSPQDPDVKKFAAQTLPTLEDHLKQAESPCATSNRASFGALMRTKAWAGCGSARKLSLIYGESQPHR